MDIFTNEPGKPYVLKPFLDLLLASSEASLAAPYFTRWQEIRHCADTGVKIELLIGLNPSTTVEAVTQVVGHPNITIRYLTGRFHAKIFLFENSALLGSSNITQGGLVQNREATIHLRAATDRERIDDVRTLFEDLWEAAEPLTAEVLKTFRIVMQSITAPAENDKKITDALGKAEPRNVNVGSKKKTRRAKYASALRKLVYEQYRPAFMEVAGLLGGHALRRPSLAELSLENETNRFLNWVKLSYVSGEDYEEAVLLPDEAERRENILRYAREWRDAGDDMVEQSYIDRLEVAEKAFATPEAIASESKDELTRGLAAIHAFSEQMRFVKKGAIEAEFWKGNGNDDAKARRSLTHLLFGPGEFVGRLHDLVYNPHYKLANFGLYCALELYGTVRPKEFPPVNGRIAKGLRYLGFKVQAD